MPERRDRSVDVHMRDGVLRKGKPLAHSDSRGRIREADTPLRKGQELGYIDEKDRVRRRAGLLRRGEVMGRIRGNAIYVGEGLLGPGLKVGYVDESGQVWQTECSSFRARVVGRARGADPEAALAYFLLKFGELDDAVKVLEQKVGESEDRYAFLPRVRAMQRVLPEVDALGDFDALVRRLDGLEETCASDLGQHIQASREAIDETVRHKPTPESILQSLRTEWGLSGLVPEQADVLVGRARAALDALNDVRRAALGEPMDEPKRPATIPPPAAPLAVEKDDRTRRVEQVLEATLGSVERVREEIDRIRHDPDYRAEDLVDKVRSAMSTVLEAGERIVAEGAGIPRRRDDRPSHRPPASLGADHGAPRAPLPGSTTSPRAPLPGSTTSPRAPLPGSTTSPRAPLPGSTTSPRAPLPGPTTAPQAPLPSVSTSPSVAIAPSAPPPSETTALVRFDPDLASESRAFVENLMKTREAEEVFEILDVGIERLRELDGVRRAGLGRLRKALDALRAPRTRR